MLWFWSKIRRKVCTSWNVFFNAYELFPRCTHINKQRLNWNKPQLATKLQPDSSVPSYSYLLWRDCVLPWAPFTTVMEMYVFWLTVRNKAGDMGSDLSRRRQNTLARCATNKSRCRKPTTLVLSEYCKNYGSLTSKCILNSLWRLCWSILAPFL